MSARKTRLHYCPIVHRIYQHALRRGGRSVLGGKGVPGLGGGLLWDVPGPGGGVAGSRG